MNTETEPVPTISPREFTIEWIKDLRSGKYKQGRGRLAETIDEESRYCCLGVACITAQRLGLKVSKSWRSNDYDGAEILKDPFFNPNVQVPRVNIPGEHGPVAVSILNDATMFTFDQIADALENTFLGKEEGR